MTDVTVKLRIGGMTCVNCQNKIEKKLRSTRGVEHVRVSYSAGAAVITYDTELVSPDDIREIISKLGYEVLEGKPRQTTSKIIRCIGALLIVVALFILMEQFGFTGLFSDFQVAEAGMGYGMLFVIGLFTSVHCVAMCGGINLSQCIPTAAKESGDGKLSALWPSFLYNLGRVISYTVVGGIVGAIGYAVSPPGMFRGAVHLIAGLFMIIMGINMLGLFPGLRILVPRMPRFFTRTTSFFFFLVRCRKAG